MGLLLLFASVLVTNVMPAPGQIGANYFETLKESQVWINIEPQNLESGPAPVEMNVTVSFPGRVLVRPPVEVDLRIQAYCLVFPTRLRQPTLTVFVDGAELPLVAPGLPYQTVAACGNPIGAVDAIVARVSFATFLRLADARDVQIYALGFAVRVTPADLQAWRSFVAAVRDGVTVK